MKKYITLLFLALSFGCTRDPLSPGASSKLTISTQTVNTINQTSAKSGIQVSGGFSSDVKDKGICWSATNYEPTINDNKSSAGAGLGFSALDLTGLTPGNTYYVRAYVITAAETLYGDQKQFTTQGYLPATLTTTTVNTITQTSALSGGNVTALGGGTVSAKGVCWNTTGTPTISNNKTSDGTGLGAYTSTLSPLSPGTVYYIRAYATNQAGTTYGPQLSFTTLSISLATISAATINSITQTSASASATVTSEGGGSVSAKGVCWSSVTTPTIANSRTIDGSGTGAFSSTLTSLNPGTTYYLRSYATNQVGTAYGTLTSFNTTAIQLATLSAVTVTGITRTSAVASGNVNDDGGGAISSRGICWSTGTAPTVPSSPYSSNGSGVGAVSASMTGLVTGTTYYLRAYAINAAGTSYGPLSSFRTL